MSTVDVKLALSNGFLAEIDFLATFDDTIWPLA